MLNPPRMLLEMSVECLRKLDIGHGSATAKEFLPLATPSVMSSAGSGWAVAPVLKGASDHPWDAAHRAVADASTIGLESTGDIAYAEPDFLQRFPFRQPENTDQSLEARARPCQFCGPDSVWPPTAMQFAWHLESAYSGLR